MLDQEAEQLANDLMQEHGLLAAGWVFAWGHGKRRLGGAEVRRYPDGRVTRTIRLSRHLVRLNDDAEVRDTILHEIAHALVGVEHGHDAAWKSMCRRIGARPERTAGGEVRMPAAGYVLVCTCCDQVVGQRYRRIAPARLARAYCRACGPDAVGKLRLDAAKPV